MKRLLSIGVSPNLERDDVWAAVRAIVKPWQYRVAPAETDLLHELQAWYVPSGSNRRLWLLNSGRSALLIFLQSLNLPPDSAVALQAFTCNAVINPVLWAKLQPLYVDIDAQSLTMSPSDLAQKITPTTKVLIIQHTFGQSADLETLLSIARQHNLIVVEDCAHALGASTATGLLGTHGDAAIFSFGRDKVISSVYGGALLVNTRTLQTAVSRLHDALPYPKRWWILQQLLHPVITRLCLRTWFWFNLGRVAFALAQRVHLLSFAVSRGERCAQQPGYFPRRLPGALASLALRQLRKLERLNTHRRQLAVAYQALLAPQQPLAESIYLRYTVRSPNRLAIFQSLQRQGIVLGDWYWSVVVPPSSDRQLMRYQSGSCPQAEAAAAEVINLPTHINTSVEQATVIARQVKAYL
jgi:dTDP-4-amino-4,6-dideoxygalactose transaminase